MIRSEMMARMSAHELSEWLAYDRIEPLPDPWGQTGTLAALIFNAWFDGRRVPSDFIPAVVTARVQTAAEASAHMEAFAAAFAAARGPHRE